MTRERSKVRRGRWKKEAYNGSLIVAINELDIKKRKEEKEFYRIFAAL